jgi:hypothetical protein
MKSLFALLCVGLAPQVNWASLPSSVGDLQLDSLLLRGALILKKDAIINNFIDKKNNHYTKTDSLCIGEQAYFLFF